MNFSQFEKSWFELFKLFFNEFQWLSNVFKGMGAPSHPASTLQCADLFFRNKLYNHSSRRVSSCLVPAQFAPPHPPRHGPKEFIALASKPLKNQLKKQKII